jgi:hypothetical protein
MKDKRRNHSARFKAKVALADVGPWPAEKLEEEAAAGGEEPR